MSNFGIAFFVTVGLLVLALWAAIYADTVGPGITRVARTAGRALVRLFTRNPQKD
jgi:hypothetical protein